MWAERVGSPPFWVLSGRSYAGTFGPRKLTSACAFQTHFIIISDHIAPQFMPENAAVDPNQSADTGDRKPEPELDSRCEPGRQEKEQRESAARAFEDSECGNADWSEAQSKRAGQTPVRGITERQRAVCAGRNNSGQRA